ncbi:helix-turn-helix domain-containing protein, partial [Serratia fonticola]
MPWDERSAMSLRTEFVLFASQEGANIRALCRQFGIAPATAYKWLHRWHSDGRAGLNERSRVPHHSPSRTSDTVVQHLRAAHLAHPMWGARKLKRWLEMQGHTLPAASTVHNL